MNCQLSNSFDVARPRSIMEHRAIYFQRSCSREAELREQPAKVRYLLFTDLSPPALCRFENSQEHGSRAMTPCLRHVSLQLLQPAGLREDVAPFLVPGKLAATGGAL